MNIVYLTALPPGSGPGREHLAGWALLRYGLLRQGFFPGESTEEIMNRAVRGEHGKPGLPGGPQFSISHSRGIVGCAVSDRPVGLDVQQARDFTPGIVGRICTDNELLLTGSDSSLLTQLWTCKESHMKLTGLGFSQGLRETEFCALGDSPVLRGDREAVFYSENFTHYDKIYWLTLCSERPMSPVIQWTDYNQL